MADVKFKTGDFNTVKNANFEEGQVLFATDDESLGGAIFLDKNGLRYAMWTQTSQPIIVDVVKEEGIQYPILLTGLDLGLPGEIIVESPTNDYGCITRFGFRCHTDASSTALGYGVTYWLPTPKGSEYATYNILTTRARDGVLRGETVAKYIGGLTQGTYEVKAPTTLSNINYFLIFYNEGHDVMSTQHTILPCYENYFAQGYVDNVRITMTFDSSTNKWTLELPSSQYKYIQQIVAFGGIYDNAEWEGTD